MIRVLKVPYNFFAKLDGDSRLLQLVRFAIVGSLATLTDLVSSLILLYWFHFHENMVTTVAFATAFMVSFWGHQHYTFKVKGSIVKFLLIALLMLFCRNILVSFMLYLGLRGILAVLIAAAAVMMLTFVLSKTMVFRQGT